MDEQLDGAQESLLERTVPLVGIEERQEPATRAEKTLETNTAVLESPHATTSEPIEVGEKTSSGDPELEKAEDTTLKKVEESSVSDTLGEAEAPGPITGVEESDVASGPGVEVSESLAVGDDKPLREEEPSSEVLGETPEPKILDFDDTPKEILDTLTKSPFENEVDSVSVIEEIPVADAPIVEEVPIVEAMTVEEVPVIEIPAVEETPGINQASEVEETPIAEEVPAIEASTVEDTPIFNEEISILGGMPIVEEVSVLGAPGFKETPITNQALGVGEDPVVVEVPVIEVPAIEETPITKDVFEPEEAPVFGETLVAGEDSEVEEATVVEKASIIKVLDVEDTPIGKEAPVLPVIVVEDTFD